MRTIFATLVEVDLAELCITSNAMMTNDTPPANAFTLSDVPGVAVVVERAVGRSARGRGKSPRPSATIRNIPTSRRDAQALREWEAMRPAAE